MSTPAIEVEPSPSVPPTCDPRIPPRDRVVTRDVMERWCRERPDKEFLVFADGGEAWTFRRLHELTVQTALGLQELGVRQGDHVLVWMANSRENLRVFFALGFLGAVYVPLNVAYRGRLLEHAVALSGARLAVVDGDLLRHLAAVDPGRLERLVVVGAPAEGPGGAHPLPLERYEEVLLPQRGLLTAPARRIEPWDPQQVMFTSGTTGPSKGVLSTYLHLYTNAGPETWLCVGEDDRFLVQNPMFHIGGTALVNSMLVRGASVAFVERFDTATFWDTVRRTRCTVAFLLGVMSSFLMKAPPSPTDPDNPLRLVFIVPLGDGVATFGPRFGVEVYTIFNMTEVSTPLYSGPNPRLPGTSGRVRDGVEVRLVDPNDCEVPVGTVGELIVRTDRPWGMNSGYLDNPQATAAAWRNGWFHTGDLFRRDAEGNYFFVDRLKDAIRRRGENISSYEIEAEALQHPAVREAAAIGVPSADSEEEVLLCLSEAEGAVIDPAELIGFLRERMAYFMVPRYLRVLADLPKTPSAKVTKQALRAEGVTADTWDREAAGIRIRRA